MCGSTQPDTTPEESGEGIADAAPGAGDSNTVKPALQALPTASSTYRVGLVLRPQPGLYGGR